jgi:hypothetical protein
MHAAYRDPAPAQLPDTTSVKALQRMALGARLTFWTPVLMLFAWAWTATSFPIRMPVLVAPQLMGCVLYLWALLRFTNTVGPHSARLSRPAAVYRCTSAVFWLTGCVVAGLLWIKALKSVAETALLLWFGVMHLALAAKCWYTLRVCECLKLPAVRIMAGCTLCLVLGCFYVQVTFALLKLLRNWDPAGFDGLALSVTFLFLLLSWLLQIAIYRRATVTACNWYVRLASTESRSWVTLARFADDTALLLTVENADGERFESESRALAWLQAEGYTRSDVTLTGLHSGVRSTCAANFFDANTQ